MFERDLPGKNTAGYNTTDIGTLPLETCDTMNGSWGFSASDQDFKSVTELVHYLARAAGYDTNLLLNVGPTLKGTFQSEVIERLEAMGKWTSEFGETIYGTRGCPMAPESWGVMTRRADTLYVHVLAALTVTPFWSLAFGSSEDKVSRSSFVGGCARSCDSRGEVDEAHSSKPLRSASDKPMSSRLARASSVRIWRAARRTATSVCFGSSVGRPPSMGYVIHNFLSLG